MKSTKSNVLVIGGAGYIGSHIVLDLCDSGYEVTVFDNLSSGSENSIDIRAEFIKGDILNLDDLESAFNKKYDSIFHFAALKSVGASMEFPNKYSQNNMIGSINILNKMIEKNIINIIFSSSACVYGSPHFLPISEEHPLEPINFYGFTKLEIEKNIIWYSRLKGIRYSILRYFNAAGFDIKGRMNNIEKEPQNLLPIIMEVASGIRPELNIFGNDHSTIDGTAVRDYIHVTDLASAHILALEYIMKNNLNLTLNLASGKGFSVLDIVRIAEKNIGKKINYSIVGKRRGDLTKLIATSLLAKKKMKWECLYSDMNIIINSMWDVYLKKYPQTFNRKVK